MTVRYLSVSIYPGTDRASRAVRVGRTTPVVQHRSGQWPERCGALTIL